MNKPLFIPSVEDWQVEDGQLFRVGGQYLNDEYLNKLKHRRDNFTIDLDGFTDVCSIPAFLVDKWYVDGFNIYEQPLVEILKRLRLEGYDDFIVCKDTTFAPSFE